MEALKGVSTVEVLNLSDCDMSEKVVYSLAAVIRSNSHPEHLDLGNNNLQSSAVTVLQALKVISTLKYLSMHN